jgi:hypothetical protein
MTNIQIARSNTDAGGPLTEPAEPTRTKIANREWIDDSGASVNEEDATGFSYEFLGRTKEGIAIPADGEKFTRYLKDMSEAEKNMLALFGAVTLSGNVTNTWMGDKDADKPAKAKDAIAARFGDLFNGKWVDRTGAVGARVDKDQLAHAICDIAEKAGDPKDWTKVREKLENDEFAKSIRSVPAIAAKYSELMGRKSPSLDALLAQV